MGRSIGEKEKMVLISFHVGKKYNAKVLKDAQNKSTSKAWVLRDIVRKYYSKNENS